MFGFAGTFAQFVEEDEVVDIMTRRAARALRDELIHGKTIKINLSKIGEDACGTTYVVSAEVVKEPSQQLPLL